jgi:uncharacterized protein DUF6894
MLYYFDFRLNGTEFPDQIGTEMRDLAEVKTEAVLALMAYAKDEADSNDKQVFAISVRNKATIVYRASLSFDGGFTDYARSNIE